MECLRDHLVLSASDLVNFLECEHLTHLDLEVATGRLALERTRTDSTELIAAKGAEHEERHLHSLRSGGAEVVEIAAPDGTRGFEADDHLSLVARMGRPQIARLREVGIDSVAALAGASSADRPARVAEPTFERLRQQARLQVDQRETGCPYSF
jgi:predicted RecB family nuclease